MNFNPQLEIRLNPASLSFEYGSGVFGPKAEFRRIDDIRSSLLDPDCVGPDPVYAIAMDVGRAVHRDELHKRHLLFGVVAYASGKLGKELVRSQGHVHTSCAHCGCSTPELIEIWQGRAIVYVREVVADDPGRCFAVDGQLREKVVMVLTTEPSERVAVLLGFLFGEVGSSSSGKAIPLTSHLLSSGRKRESTQH
jgi:glucose-6-phosphate isomerase, archaeal